MINNVLILGDTCAKDIMIPKVDITMVPIDVSYDELYLLLSQINLPVYLFIKMIQIILWELSTLKICL